MTSKAELGLQSVARFNDWITERERAGDWETYVRAGKINRSEVAKECDFGRSAWVQNEGLVAALKSLEARLAERGLLDARLDTTGLSDAVKAEIGAAENRASRAMAARGSLQQRVKMLEEQNAALRAENRDLMQRLRRTAFAEQHLAEHGRMLPP
jgi:hypothetical protein